MVQSRSLGKKPYETLRRVAKYYLTEGFTKKETRELLDTFVARCEPRASLAKWSDTIDFALDRALKSDAVNIEYITVTKPEMARIDALGGKQLQRLAFTLLCLSKYWDAVNAHGDHWVNSADSDIVRMANVNTSVRRQSAMYHTLREAGMIQFSKRVDNTNVRVCFIEDGEEALRVSDFRNLGYQYLMSKGEPYFVCANCGLVTRYSNPIKGRKQKYCKACAYEVKMKQNIDSAMRVRATAPAPA